MNQFYLLILLVGHYVADFLLQTDAQAKGKSRAIKPLLEHTAIYALVFFLITMWLLNLVDAIWFALITFAAHTITDFVTSKLVRHYFEKEDYHNGFVVIGFDQMLHYLQLYFTLKLLM